MNLWGIGSIASRKYSWRRKSLREFFFKWEKAENGNGAPGKEYST
jgi:hypothetical protein